VEAVDKVKRPFVENEGTKEQLMKVEAGKLLEAVDQLKRQFVEMNGPGEAHVSRG
jgi:hypothetical protein